MGQRDGIQRDTEDTPSLGYFMNSPIPSSKVKSRVIPQSILSSVSCCASSPTRNLFVVGGNGGTVITNWSENTILHQIEEESTKQIWFSEDGLFLFILNSLVVKKYDIVKDFLEVARFSIRYQASSLNGEDLVRLYEGAKGQYHQRTENFLAVSDNHAVFTTSSGVEVWSLKPEKQVKVFRLKKYADNTLFKIQPYTEILAVINLKIELFLLDAPKKVWKEARIQRELKQFAFFHTRNQFATLQHQGTVLIWTMEFMKPIRQYQWTWELCSGRMIEKIHISALDFTIDLKMSKNEAATIDIVNSSRTLAVARYLQVDKTLSKLPPSLFREMSMF